MPITFQGPAPYAPAPAVITVIEKHRTIGLASPIDATRLAQIGVSETLVPRTLKALRLLDLLKEDGSFTEQMEVLGKVPPNEFKDRVAEWIRSVYAPVFSVVDPSTATAKDIENAFFGYEPKGQLARMVTLFSGLCEYAGIIEKRPVKKPGPVAGRTASSTDVGRKKTKSILRQVGEVPLRDLKPDSGQGPPAQQGLGGAKERYVNLLLAKLEAQDSPDTDLFDRIERVLGIASMEDGSS